ncbi:homoserine/homoserine lactone efflux protein [Vibrio sp. ZSDZ34]|jgi:homoserine/homoserine lactone efflux protein|uniref:Homoserine/homoserine lactone efflux protein n=1 Tax=Vibrio gelatinilyticus TaxID=2893468 RepID=A0A9X2B0L5_9VIBR|nr:homoserine/homoserine lactone efflux protein [Vibrio gelatinilyticus]MCJ2378733.1 homoserine/homoserine lactone efflux protein [Vibrio gelatinilyticus]
MDYHVWLAYVVTAIVFSLAPGSGTVNSISNGINYGTKKSLAAILGLQIGLAFHIALVGAGIGALVAQSAVAFSLIKWIGVVYLLWLGVQKWREKANIQSSEQPLPQSSVKLLRSAILINLTNPKSIVFLVALFPQFLDPGKDQLPQLLVLGVTTVCIDAFVMLGYTSLAAQLGRYIRSERIMGRINKVFGSMFVGCGALLAAAKS